MNNLLLLAQAATGEAEQPSNWPLFLFFTVVFIAFYFFILAPQRKEEKQRKELLGGLKKGDKVITAGGINAVVVETKSPETVTLEIARNVHVVFNRTSVSVIDTPKEKSEKPADSKTENKAKK